MIDITKIRIGSVVRVTPTPQRAGGYGRVTRMRGADAAGLEVEIEFTGREWFYPHRSWFRASELSDEIHQPAQGVAP